MEPEKVTYFAETDSRNKRVRFGIKAKDRTRHMYVIGKTGMGKSTLLENMAIQDIQNGEGMAFIDPHGKTAELLLEYIPPERMKDVLYFAPFDLEHPISFNVMEDVGDDKRHLVASGLMSTFKKIWEDAWSARMEYILSNTILALLEFPGATLLGVNRMLSDKEFRKVVVDNIKDPSVKSFWTEEFAKYTDRFAAEATPAIQNKVGQFTSNPLIRNIVGQEKSSFDIRKIMDEKKILIINLSKGRVGESNAMLLGSMLVTKIYLAAMSRADIQEKELKKLPNFYLYVDEFQSFANESFANILSEARKYKLNLTITHQYIEQMPEEVRAAVFGNVGTMITFRVGAFDAEVLEKEFAPQFTAEDLVNLGIFQIYLKLMIDGASSTPFSGATLPPYPEPVISYKREIIEESRRQFAHPRAMVEDSIKKWFASDHKLVAQSKSFPPSKVSPISVVEPDPVSAKSLPVLEKVLPKKEFVPKTEQKPILPNHEAKPIFQKPQAQEKPVLPIQHSRPVFQKPPLIDDTEEDGEGFLPLKEMVKKVTNSDLSSSHPSFIPGKTGICPSTFESERKQHGELEINKPKNISDLKSAIEAVLGSKIPDNNNANLHQNKSEIDKKPEIKLEQKPPIKEIPEKELRDMLRVEKLKE
ncbi:MAG: type IV secretion system DNA-binding domain-containing protein [Minisyncoccia bacterium]